MFELEFTLNKHLITSFDLNGERIFDIVRMIATRIRVSTLDIENSITEDILYIEELLNEETINKAEAFVLTSEITRMYVLAEMVSDIENNFLNPHHN